MVLDEKSRFARTVPNPISSNIKIIKQRLISGFGTVLANLDFSSKTIQHLYEIVSNVCLVLA
jgi:Tfp pilus tip-associated adhesin PilY1